MTSPLNDKSHLLRFGYAPGNYWFHCRDCGNKRAEGDKRSTRCEACAETLYSQVTSVEAVSDKHRSTPMTIPDEAVQAAASAVEFPIRGMNGLRLALTAALPFLTGVKVKALEWVAHKGDQHCKIAWTCEGIGGWYAIEHLHEGHFDMWTPNNPDGGRFSTLESAKSAAQADYEARILSAIEVSGNPGQLEPSPRAQAFEEGDLNARLKAKGMYTIDEMMGTLPVDKWRVQSGMTDLKFFGEWLERKTREYLTMKAAYDAGDKDESDELYEWVLAHYGAFHDVLVNFRAALSSQPVADGCKAYVGEMKTSAGIDYFVMIKSGDRELSIRKHQWKHHADYEAAEYNWLFNVGEKPDILAFHPVSGGSSILPASPGASE